MSHELNFIGFFVPNRGNEETPYNIAHAMPYPRSKAEAERIVVRANGTEVPRGLYTLIKPWGLPKIMIITGVSWAY